MQERLFFKRATRLERCHLVNDLDSAPILHESHGRECDDTFGYAYVDNRGVLSTSPARASDVTGKVTTTFDNAGLLTHEVSVRGSQVISHGTNVDGAPWRHVDFGDCDAELTPF